MKSLNSLLEVQQSIENNPFILLYLSQDDCGLCKSLKPKVEKLLSSYPFIAPYYVDLKKDPMISGQLSIYTIPGILIYVNQKESYRGARYISIKELKEYLERLHSIINDL